MNITKLVTRAILVLFTGLVVLSLNSCEKEDKDKEISGFVVKLDESDEDYINFGTFENFTKDSDWSIIETVKFESGASGGWHFFRGKAWVDKEGDIAISINESRVHAWVREGDSWINVIHETTYTPDTWYTICFQYSYATTTLDLYVDGVHRGSVTVDPMDDSENDNNLFWGGQEALPDDMVGDIYSETSVTIAHQAWYQRVLTTKEIKNYYGSVDDSDPDLVFSSAISATSVTDASGNGHNGTNGNTPEFIEL